MIEKNPQRNVKNIVSQIYIMKLNIHTTLQSNQVGLCNTITAISKGEVLLPNQQNSTQTLFQDPSLGQMGTVRGNDGIWKSYGVEAPVADPKPPIWKVCVRQRRGGGY